MNPQKITLIGMLITVALLTTYIEHLLPPLVPAIPGFKLGLANIVILSLLYLFNGKTALCVNLLRILLAGFLFAGFSSILYALAGGILSFVAMYFAKKCSAFSILGVSVLGAALHNVGQIFVAILVMQNKKLLYYFPMLTISAIITGLIVGLAAFYLVRQIGRAHV